MWMRFGCYSFFHIVFSFSLFSWNIENGFYRNQDFLKISHYFLLLFGFCFVRFLKKWNTYYAAWIFLLGFIKNLQLQREADEKCAQRVRVMDEHHKKEIARLNKENESLQAEIEKIKFVLLSSFSCQYFFSFLDFANLSILFSYIKEFY